MSPIIKSININYEGDSTDIITVYQLIYYEWNGLYYMPILERPLYLEEQTLIGIYNKIISHTFESFILYNTINKTKFILDESIKSISTNSDMTQLESPIFIDL